MLRARIEDDAEAERERLALEQSHLLSNAVLGDLEIDSGHDPRIDRLVTLGEADRNPDELDTGLECGLLPGERRRTAEPWQSLERVWWPSARSIIHPHGRWR